MTTNELLPCPFCGGEAKLVPTEQPKGWMVSAFHVMSCPMTLLTHNGCDTFVDKESATAAWNTRHVETCRMEPLNAFYTDLNGLNQTEWGVCSNCGTASPIDATYCCECGRKVER